MSSSYLMLLLLRYSLPEVIISSGLCSNQIQLKYLISLKTEKCCGPTTSGQSRPAFMCFLPWIQHYDYCGVIHFILSIPSHFLPNFVWSKGSELAVWLIHYNYLGWNLELAFSLSGQTFFSYLLFRIGRTKD